MPKKVFIALAAFIFLLTTIFVNLISSVEAASLTTLSDTLTRLQKGELSSHTIRFSLPDTKSFDAGKTIEYDFGEDEGIWNINGANSSIEDFNFYDGSKRNIVGLDGDCTDHFGSNDIAIAIDNGTGLVLLSPCENFVSSSSGTSITFKIGSAADGKDVVRNPSKSGSAIMKITHTSSTDEIHFGQLAVPIMDFDGVGISTQKSAPSSDILGVQKVQTTKEEVTADSSITNHSVNNTSTPSDLNLITDNCFLTNFTSKIPSF